MSDPVDAAVLAALEAQRRELTFVLGRLEAARSTLLPGPANFWYGSARDTYNAGIESLRVTVDAGIAAVRSSRDRTSVAIAGMGQHV